VQFRPIGVEWLRKGAHQLAYRFAEILAHDALPKPLSWPRPLRTIERRQWRGFAAKFQRKVIKNWCEFAKAAVFARPDALKLRSDFTKPYETSEKSG
jgi:hypothetical protein